MKAHWTSDRSRRWTLRYIAVIVTVEAAVILAQAAVHWWH